MSVAVVILAAGASSRMGRAKALLEIEGGTFLQRIATTARAAGAGGISVVAGPPDGDRIKARLPLGVSVTWNPDPSRGMITSIQTGISNLPARTTAALFWPVDIPLVNVDTVQRVMQAPAGRIAIPRHGGRGGHPVRVPARHFGAIAALPVESSLRAYFDTQAGEIAWIDVEDPGCVRDFDTPQDLDELKDIERR